MKTQYLLTPLIFLLMTAFIPVDTNAKVEWRDWEEGIEEASEEDKVLLLSIYTDWCGWCRRMDQNTYANEDIADKIHEDFVPVKLNPEEEDKSYQLDGHEFSGAELVGMLTQGQRTGYPTTLFLLVDERRVFMESGYQDPERFSNTLSNILSKAQAEKAE